MAIDVDNKVFCEDVVTEMNISGVGILPPFLNATFIQNDLVLFEQMDAVEANLEKRVAKNCRPETHCRPRSFWHGERSRTKFTRRRNFSGIPGAKQAYDKLKLRYDAQSIKKVEDRKKRKLKISSTR